MRTVGELIVELGLLPADMAANYITEAGLTNITGAEIEHLAMRVALEHEQGIDVATQGNGILVILPPGTRSAAAIDEEIAALWEALSDE